MTGPWPCPLQRCCIMADPELWPQLPGETGYAKKGIYCTLHLTNKCCFFFFVVFLCQNRSSNNKRSKSSERLTFKRPNHTQQFWFPQKLNRRKKALASTKPNHPIVCFLIYWSLLHWHYICHRVARGQRKLIRLSCNTPVSLCSNRINKRFNISVYW